MIKKSSIICLILIISILLGVFLRFYKLDSLPVGGSDELILMISALKFHHQSFDAGRLFISFYVPLGKWTLGLPTIFIDADYEPLKLIGQNMYVWSYLSYEALGKTYVAMRSISAFCGVLTIIFIFLITRKIFNTRAALWSAVLISLSSDFFGYSRIGFTESIAFMYCTGTIYFYLKYLSDSGIKKYLFAGIMFIFLIFSLASRLYQPLFLIPILILSQFFLRGGWNRIQRNITFTGIIILCVYIVFNFIYPPSLIHPEEMRFEGSPFGVGLPYILISLLTRNSYMFLFSLFLSAYYYSSLLLKKDGNNESFITKTKDYIKRHNHSFIIFVYILITIGVLSFAAERFLSAKYLMFLFLPLFILGGNVISRLSKNKFILSFLLILLGLNIFYLVYNFPFGIQYYSNFGLYDTFGYHSMGIPVTSDENLDKIFSYLDKKGNPIVVSNHIDLLISYKGKSVSIPISIEQRCNNEYIDDMKNKKAMLIYRENSGRKIFNDQYICPIFHSLNLKLENEFENIKLYSFE